MIMPSMISFINPFSKEYNRLDDFKHLSTKQQVVTVLVTIFTGIFTLGIGATPCFRSLVNRFKKLKVDDNPAAEKAHDLAKKNIPGLPQNKPQEKKPDPFKLEFINLDDPKTYPPNFKVIKPVEEQKLEGQPQKEHKDSGQQQIDKPLNPKLNDQIPLQEPLIPQKPSVGIVEEKKEPTPVPAASIQNNKIPGKVYFTDTSEIAQSFQNELNRMLNQYPSVNLFVLSMQTRIDHVTLPKVINQFKEDSGNKPLIIIVLQRRIVSTFTPEEINSNLLSWGIECNAFIHGQRLVELDPTGMSLVPKLSIENEGTLLKEIEEKMKPLSTS